MAKVGVVAVAVVVKRGGGEMAIGTVGESAGVEIEVLVEECEVEENWEEEEKVDISRSRRRMELGEGGQ